MTDSLLSEYGSRDGGRPHVTWTQADDDRLIRLFEQKNGTVRIAIVMGVSRATVKNHIRRLRLAGRLPPSQKRGRSPAVRDNYSKIANAWASALKGRRFNNSVEGR